MAKVGDALGQAAAAEGWEPNPELLDLVAEALDATAEPRVAIVSRSQEHALERVLARAVPDARVTKLAVADDARDRHVMLAAGGPMDLIVDLAGGSAAKRRFQDQLFHTKPGGTLLCRIPGKERTLLQYVDEIQELRSSDTLQPPTSARRETRGMGERDRHALAASLRRLEVRAGFVLAVNDVETLAKLREIETNRFLELRPESGRVIERVSGVEFASTATLRVSAEDGPPFAAPATFPAPELSLRQYRQVACWPRQVAIHDNVVLPATFRHNAKPRLRNNVVMDWAPDFVRRPTGGTVSLAGDYYYLDNQFRGHFGHLLTEQISQLWGWRRSKDEFPNLRALVLERPGQPMADWEFGILEAGGLPREDVHVAREPVSVESLVVASPMFSMPDFVHPRISETYRAIGDELEPKGTIETWPERVFCSRRGRRAGHNRDEIEQTFVDAGFRVMYPEELSLGDQVRLVRRAQVIAGFSGSGMFQIAFAARPKHVILLGSESYTASNEYMIASVVGHRLDVVLCRPDVPRQGRFSPASYHSNFTYDPDREGRFLRQVLAEL